ncbi:MAG: DUF115 domain-containing protein [Opitutales bacterium]|nr:DUF115 domain-containing protein [Opitutales bacterium]NRA27634.1 DUF115 domain-containing protein [Opitutales bacterium]
MNATRQVVIFGSGLRGKEVLNQLPPSDQVLFFVDNESALHGQTVSGHPIYPVEVLAEAEFDTVVIATRGNQAAYCQLVEMGIDRNNIISPLMSEDNLDRLSNLRNAHKGDTIFIVGNGDSLSNEDLERIADTGHPSIAFNDIFQRFNQTSFRPSYYVVEDPIFARENPHQILNMKHVTKLFPEQIIGTFPPADDIVYYGLNEEISPTSSSYFSESPLNFGFGATVVYPALQLAVYMGARKIYLVGIDFTCGDLEALPRELRAIAANGCATERIYGECRKDEHWVEAHQRYAIKAFRTAQRFAAYRGISIMNASRGGQLEVYPRVRIETILQH